MWVENLLITNELPRWQFFYLIHNDSKGGIMNAQPPFLFLICAALCKFVNPMWKTNTCQAAAPAPSLKKTSEAVCASEVHYQ
jgi:hypothetical protein